MKLYKLAYGSIEPDEEVTLADLKAALAEHGMVAVPVEPCQRIMYAGWGEHYQLATDAGKYSARSDYKSIIKAAEEGYD